MGAEDQRDSPQLECKVETLEPSVVDHPSEVVHFEFLLAQTENSSGHLRQVVPLKWGVLSYLGQEERRRTGQRLSLLQES